MTRVILLRDVSKVGKKYEIKEVSSGYATNYLYPNKLAEQATPAKEAVLAKMRDEMGAAKVRHADELAKMVKALDGSKVHFKTKTDATGHLFKKMRVEDVAHVLKAGHHADLPLENIHLKEPVKTAGEHTIEISGGSAKGKFVLVVEKE